MIPATVMEQWRSRTREITDQRKPVNWTAAMVIIVIWLLLARFAYSIMGRIL